MIEKAVVRISDVKYDNNEKKLFEWFINQNHIPIDLTISQYKEIYDIFIKELIQLFKLTKSEYYWFGQNGRLISDEGAPIIDCNNFKIDRDIMKNILRNNILEDLLSN
jgi:ribose 5-phosphate isomerase